MKKWLLDQIKKKEEARAALKGKGKASDKIEEVRSIQSQIDAIDIEIAEFRQKLEAMPDETEPQQRNNGQNPPAGATLPAGVPANTPVVDPATGETRGLANPPAGAPQGLNPIGTYTNGQSPEGEKRAVNLVESEKRGKELLEQRSVTVGSVTIIMPEHQASDIRPGFNEVSSLIDRVTTKPLLGGESYKQPYIAGYGIGDYKTEGEEYADAEPTFGYAQINKTKVTAYAEDTEELVKLPAADYDGEVMKGIRIASRKKITREILIGSGATNHLVGIFSNNAAAIDALTDVDIVEIDELTLDEIIFSFGGDEDVEDAAVLILNKKDLKAFAQLRTADGKKIHTIVSNGNTGTIDGVPFIINSACKAISDASTVTGGYSMAYGPLSNYMLTIFSDMDVQRSTDYKFKQGMIAHRGSIFVGGNVVSKNGFLRVKKG